MANCKRCNKELDETDLELNLLINEGNAECCRCCLEGKWEEGRKEYNAKMPESLHTAKKIFYFIFPNIIAWAAVIMGIIGLGVQGGRVSMAFFVAMMTIIGLMFVGVVLSFFGGSIIVKKRYKEDESYVVGSHYEITVSGNKITGKTVDDYAGSTGLLNNLFWSVFGAIAVLIAGIFICVGINSKEGKAYQEYQLKKKEAEVYFEKVKPNFEKECVISWNREKDETKFKSALRSYYGGKYYKLPVFCGQTRAQQVESEEEYKRKKKQTPWWCKSYLPEESNRAYLLAFNKNESVWCYKKDEEYFLCVAYDGLKDWRWGHKNVSIILMEHIPLKDIPTNRHTRDYTKTDSFIADHETLLEIVAQQEW